MSLSVAAKACRGDFDLDFAFDSDAHAVAVEGASGAGKTTLLMALAGLVPSSSTRLVVDDKVVVDLAAGVRPAPHRRRIGYVFQDGRLFPHLSVADNVAFGRRFAANPIPVAETLALLDLTGFEARWPNSLSGGEARRVALARALCRDPAILFLDEPFAGLDQKRRDALMPYLIRLRDDLSIPILLVSHDPRDADALAQDRVQIESGRRVG